MFTPSKPLPDAELAGLPGATSCETRNRRIVISGTDETVNAVISLLARLRITAQQLRVAEATLDDAFLDLTEHPSPAQERGLTEQAA